MIGVMSMFVGMLVFVNFLMVLSCLCGWVVCGFILVVILLFSVVMEIMMFVVWCCVSLFSRLMFCVMSMFFVMSLIGL